MGWTSFIKVAVPLILLLMLATLTILRTSWMRYTDREMVSLFSGRITPPQFHVSEEDQAMKDIRWQMALEYAWPVDWHHCKWRGIRCDGDHHVISINITKILNSESSPSPCQYRLGCRFPNMIHPLLQLNHLREFIGAYANFGGELPTSSTAVLCKNLTILDLSNNQLSGKIPMDIATCSSLQLLDLEANLLKGKLSPTFFSAFPLAHRVSVAHNHLDGDVPRNVSSVFHLEGNCFDGIPFQLTDCSSMSPQHGWTKRSIIITSLVAAILVGMVAIVGGLALRWRMQQQQILKNHQGSHLRRFTMKELEEATAGFKEENLVRSGSSSLIYKGVLFGDVQVVVQKVSRSLREAFLMDILDLYNCRRKDAIEGLVPLLGYCMSTSGERSNNSEEGAACLMLVFKHMGGGNLATRLPCLGWLDRKVVALRVAEALARLHECNPPIIHRDIEASSILLDEALGVRLGSLFDISQGTSLGSWDAFASSSPSYSIGSGIGGSGSMGEIELYQFITPTQDVQGFGKVLIHLITGLAIIGEEECTRRFEWLNSIDQSSFLYATEILDRHLMTYEEGNFTEELLNMADVWDMAMVAKTCLHPNPSRRPSMTSVVRDLRCIVGVHVSEVPEVEEE